MKNSFVLYTDYFEQTQSLTDEQMGKLFRAILQYVSSGEIVDLDIATKMAFDFIKVKIDRDEKKYEEVCEKRREAGRKGAKAKAGKCVQNKQKLANQAENDNDNENENDNDNENDNENDKDKKNPLNNTYIHNAARAPLAYTMASVKEVSK